ncbi:MAG TPA: YceI family protein [Solirubrobacterales bacterium]|nr:YceI family protein [Solirubrobacterales bacterium]HNA45039.1 YceI family protein [Solirubrobacterales bacterium]HNC06638.1 YceI family protein [Solirubrobacterales bacterium]HNC15215.1 YceI family protein [Solirubrobacterales bacterium]HNK66326.1 YceI family protein [Solirubrobacterales bacterium]
MSTTEQAVRIETGTYAVDPVHTQVGFEVKHLGISTFRGSFGGFEGNITVGDEGIVAIEGSIDVSTVAVPEEQLIGHLLSPDFFDAENHPKGTFVSTGVNQVDGETYEVTGNLTLRGVTNPVTLTVEVEGAGIGMDGSSVLSLKANGEVNRNDYGISWGAALDNGAAVVAEKVRLVLTVEAVKAGE